jgi:type I restriction enzyme M protein
VRRLNSLSKENMTRIVESYQKFSSAEGFSKPIDMTDIVDNDYNLNVTLYVMPIEKSEKMDLTRELAELRELEKERQEITNKVVEYVVEIERAGSNSKDDLL